MVIDINARIEYGVDYPGKTGDEEMLFVVSLC
jgi:hypothetical protein